MDTKGTTLRIEVDGQQREIVGTAGPLRADGRNALVGLLSFDEGAAPCFLLSHSDDDGASPSREIVRSIRLRVTHFDPKDYPLRGETLGGCISCTDPRSPGMKPNTELEFSVPSADYASLTGDWLRITVDLGSPVGKPHSLNSWTAFFMLDSLSFQPVAPDPSGSNVHRRALELDALDLMSAAYLTEGSQAWTIAVELARSAAEGVVAGGDRDELFLAALNTLKYARSSFRSAWGYDSSISDIWYSDAHEFRQHRVYSDDMAAKYDELWRHFNVREAWHLSTTESQPFGHGFDVGEDGKQLVLQDLVDHPSLESPTLEWAIADSLAYLGCIEFANTMGDKRQAAGRERDPQKEIERSGAAHFTRRTGILVAKVIVWLLLAWLLYAGANWLLGATAALFMLVAWIAWQIIGKLYRRDRPDPLAREEALLERMYAFSEALGKPDFSGAWANIEVRALETAGAKFSPVLGRVLSMRARREKADGATVQLERTP